MIQQFKSKRFFRVLLALFLLFTLTLSLLPAQGLAANEFSYNVASVYRVTSDNNTRVEDTYSVTNYSNDKYLDKIQIATPVEDAKNISVEYADGTSIPFTTSPQKSSQQGYDFDYTEIDIQFTRNIVGRNTNWQFIVTYDTDKLVETKGSAHTVSIPAVPQEGNNQYSVNLFVPENYGTIHTTGYVPENLGTKRGETQYLFKDKKSLEKSASLVFGDSTIYEVNFNYPLNNDSSFPSTFTVTLPPNTSGQQVTITKLDPEPNSTRLDVDGNILADYNLPPKSKVVVKTNVIAVVSYIEYNLSASGTKDQIPSDLVQRYTSSQQYWPASDPEISAKARELTAGKSSVADQVKSINDYVVSKLNYNNEKIKYNIRQGGKKAFQNPDNAVCLEYSDLTISLLRAAGIPARMPVGYGYSGSLKQSNSVTDSLHSWVQAYVPNVGWMNLDPTWSEKFDNFGSSDLDHFAFALWGSSDNSPVAVTQNGKDTNYQYENTTIEYKAVPPTLQPSGDVKVDKWLIFPFVALNKFVMTAPTSTAGDNYMLRTRQGVKIDLFEIGSLAPKQTNTRYALVLGQTAWGVVNVDFTQNNATNIIISSAKASAQMWPMWVVLVTIAGIFIFLMVKSKLTKDKLRKSKNSKTIPTIKKAEGEKIK